MCHRAVARKVVYITYDVEWLCRYEERQSGEHLATVT